MIRLYEDLKGKQKSCLADEQVMINKFVGGIRPAIPHNICDDTGEYIRQDDGQCESGEI